jgi:DNA replicative helicase MCM subunit Mcm2 (Cdc46/Mcm family)
MAFEGDIISFADQGLSNDDHRINSKNNTIVQGKFFKFIMDWSNDGAFRYKEQLISNAGLDRFHLKVELADMEAFDQELTTLVRHRPISFIPIMERAAQVTQVDQARIY